MAHTRKHPRWRRCSRRQRGGQLNYQNAFATSAKHAGKYVFYAVRTRDVPRGPELTAVSAVRPLPSVSMEYILTHREDEYTLYFTEGERVLCILSFAFKYDDVAATAELKMVSCPNKPTNVSLRPVSAVMFYRLASILQKAGIQYIALSVAATGDRFWRLMELYETFGFKCVPVDEHYEANIGAAVTHLQDDHIGNAFLQEQRLSRALRNAREYYLRCSNMVARVPVVSAATGAILGI